MRRVFSRFLPTSLLVLIGFMSVLTPSAARAEKKIGYVFRCDGAVLLRHRASNPVLPKPNKPQKNKSGHVEKPNPAPLPAPAVPCKPHTDLLNGDQIEIKEGGKVQFLVGTGVYVLDTPCKITVAENGVKSGNNALTPAREVSSSSARLVASGPLAFSGLGVRLKTAARGGGIIELSPVGAALDANVVLTWDASGFPANRVLLICEDTGETLLDLISKDKMPRDQRFDLSKATLKGKLEAGKLYSWEVKAGYGAFAVFRILTAEQRQTLQSMLDSAEALKEIDDTGEMTDLAAARAYAHFAVMDKAMVLYNGLKTKRADNADFLAEYAKAKAEFERYTKPEKRP